MSIKTARKIPFWATAFTAAGMIVLCGLGGWQVQRLAWKNTLLAQLDTAYAAAPVMAGPAAIRALHDGGQPPFFGRVTVEGVYDDAHALLVGPRTRDGRTGHHLIMPLTVDGATLLVNRGWLADKQAAPAAAGPVRVTGLLRLPEEPNPFVPANDPAQGRWYSIDIAAMTQGLPDALPLVLYAEGEEPAAAIAYHTDRPAIRNNHRDYAFFWFAMAGVLAIIYALRFLRRPK